MIGAKNLLQLSVCCMVLLLAPTAATADAVIFGFTGVVTQVDAPLSGEFSVGEQVVGNYTFESSTADSDADPAVGFYDNAITAFTATFGGDYTVTQGVDNDIFVANGPPGNDVYNTQLANPTGPTVAGLPLTGLNILLIDADSTVFASDALPLTPPDLAEFEFDFSGQIFFDSPGNQTMDFQLTSLTLIPEPTTLVLSSLGLLGLCCRRRGRG